MKARPALYESSERPDNYSDPSMFLNTLELNKNVRRYRLSRLLLGSIQVSRYFVIVVGFWGAATASPSVSSSTTTAAGQVSHMSSSPGLSPTPDDRSLLYLFFYTTIAAALEAIFSRGDGNHGWVRDRNGLGVRPVRHDPRTFVGLLLSHGIVIGGIFVLSPFLYSMLENWSRDTLLSLSAALLFAHCLFQEYRDGIMLNEFQEVSSDQDLGSVGDGLGSSVDAGGRPRSSSELRIPSTRKEDSGDATMKEACGSIQTVIRIRHPMSRSAKTCAVFAAVTIGTSSALTRVQAKLSRTTVLSPSTFVVFRTITLNYLLLLILPELISKTKFRILQWYFSEKPTQLSRKSQKSSEEAQRPSNDSRTTSVSVSNRTSIDSTGEASSIFERVVGLVDLLLFVLVFGVFLLLTDKKVQDPAMRARLFMALIIISGFGPLFSYLRYGKHKFRIEGPWDVPDET